MKVKAAFYVQFGKVDNSFRELQKDIWENASSPSTLVTVRAQSCLTNATALDPKNECHITTHTLLSLSHMHTNTGQGSVVYCFPSLVVFLHRPFECLPNRLSCHGLIGFLTQIQFSPPPSQRAPLGRCQEIV